MRKGELTFIDAMHVYSDDLSIYKKLSEKYKQVGNAVPVNLAKEIGLEIKRTLEVL